MTAPKRTLTRDQCIDILELPPRTNLVAYAKRHGFHIDVVRHVRRKCRWMLRKGRAAR